MRPSLRTRLALVALAALATPNATRAQPARSAAIEELAAELRREGAAAEERFWASVKEGGAPLVEAADRPGSSIVTFVYRGDAETTAVRLESNINALAIDGITTDFEALGTMERLPETDVWHIAYAVGNDVRIPYGFEVLGPGPQPLTVLDPHNDAVWEPDVEALRASILELPGAPPQPWRGRAAEAGDWDELELGADEGPRRVWVYKPAAYDPGRPRSYPALIGLGAFGIGVGMRVDRMVDHLIETGRIPTTVVALTDLRPESEAARYGPTVRAVIDTVLPYLRANYSVSTNPREIVIAGTSRRGLVSAIVALERPDAIGNVLSLSGSFYWRPEDEGEFEWLSTRLATSPLQDVRFYLAAGSLETVVTPRNRGHYMVSTNRHMRDVLRARGYDLRYVEFNGVHSELNWQDWLADGLVHFLGRGFR